MTSVLFSPDGRWITSGSVDSTVKVRIIFPVTNGNLIVTQLWDVGSSNLVKEFNLHRNEVTSVKFHPNELVLATASMDRYCNICMSVCVFVYNVVHYYY